MPQLFFLILVLQTLMFHFEARAFFPLNSLYSNVNSHNLKIHKKIHLCRASMVSRCFYPNLQALY